MSTSRYVALLRGINVGGNNLIRMVDLRSRFEQMGFADVVTYIQSGNVLFSSRRSGKAALLQGIERALSDGFGYTARVILLSGDELERVVAQAPTGYGTQPARYRYYVLFANDPSTTREALEQITLKPGVDAVHRGAHALYFRQLMSKLAQSRLTRLIQLPVYRSLTIRNWNTTTRLLKMLRESGSLPPSRRKPVRQG